jgi:methylated-DNA-protein-cysteine methyltransferase related protein
VPPISTAPRETMFDEILRKVARIPRGKVATYGQVAEAAGFPGGARQVVWALRAARRPVPWHRVIGARGRIRLGGFEGLEQILRLEQEGVKVTGNRVDLRQFRHEFGRPPAPKKK